MWNRAANYKCLGDVAAVTDKAEGGLMPERIGSPLVTVIIPAFNYDSLIAYTLESILGQEYRNWECLVVDDGSEDDTASVVNWYRDRDKRIAYIYQQNGGPGNARNNGLSQARGKYIQFLDADDLIERRKLQCHVQYLENNPEVDIVYGGARYFRTDRPNERRYSMMDIDAPWMPEISGSGEEVLQALVKANIMVVSAPLLRRRVIDQVGLFDEKLSTVEDWDYWIRCAIKGARFQYLDEVGALSLIRCHSNSLSQNSLKARKQVIRLRQKLDKILQDDALIEYNRLTDLLDVRSFGVELVEAGRPFSAIRYLLGAAMKSATWGESLKWMYSALVAPFAPRRNFHKIVYSPIGESLSALLIRTE
jgi:glycosyltransferase involved in cell wall biosynthesis